MPAAWIKVHYVAEPFPKDGTLALSFLKMMKRTMAAEYPREFSTKVQAGHYRGASSVFKEGGVAAYGLGGDCLIRMEIPRWCLSAAKEEPAIGQVIYTLAREEEVAHRLRHLRPILTGNVTSWQRQTAHCARCRASGDMVGVLPHHDQHALTSVRLDHEIHKAGQLREWGNIPENRTKDRLPQRVPQDKP
jgi:hypothetical protein